MKSLFFGGLAVAGALLMSAGPASAAPKGRVGIVALDDDPATIKGTASAARRCRQAGVVDVTTQRKLAGPLKNLRTAGAKCQIDGLECLVKLGLFSDLDEVIAFTTDSEGAQGAVRVDVAEGTIVERVRATVGRPMHPTLVDGVAQQVVSGPSGVGRLALVVEPGDLEVILNGKSLGRAVDNREIGPIAPGRHRVRVRAPSGKLEKRRVKVVAEKTATVTIDVRPPAPPPAAEALGPAAAEAASSEEPGTGPTGTGESNDPKSAGADHKTGPAPGAGPADGDRQAAEGASVVDEMLDLNALFFGGAISIVAHGAGIMLTGLVSLGLGVNIWFNGYPGIDKDRRSVAFLALAWTAVALAVVGFAVGLLGGVALGGWFFIE